MYQIQNFKDKFLCLASIKCLHLLILIIGLSGVAMGGDAPPPNHQKNHSLKKAKSVEKWGGGGTRLGYSPRQYNAVVLKIL